MDFFASQLARVPTPVTDEYWWSLVIESGVDFGGREELCVECKLESKKGKCEKAVKSSAAKSPELSWNFKAYQSPHTSVLGKYKGIQIKVKRSGGAEVGNTFLPWESVGAPDQNPTKQIGLQLTVTNSRKDKIGFLRVVSGFQRYQENAQAPDHHDVTATPGGARSRTEQAIKKLNESGSLLWGSGVEGTSRVTFTATGKREILVPTTGPAKFASYSELPPFDVAAAASKKVSYNNALWLCIAAQLAYKKEEIIHDVCTNVWDMDGCIFLEHKPTDTQGYIMHNDKIMVISFRGTETATNWKSNAKFIAIPGNFPERYQQGGVRVHMGFHDALQHVWKQISEAVEDVFRRIPHIKLYICGHSLGGALATMCFAFLTLADRPRPVAAIYTIGQPRIGNKPFCKILKQNSPNTVYARITNNQDIVPSVPPSLCHFGIHLHISPSGRFSTNPTLWQKNLEEISLQQSLVTDHPTACYRLLIEQEFARQEANRLGQSTSLYSGYERAILVIDMILEGVKGVHFGRTQLYAIVAQVFHLKPLLDAASEYFVLLQLRQKTMMETQFVELNKFLVELQTTVNKYRKKANAKNSVKKVKDFNEKMGKFCGSIQPICNRINDILLEVNGVENFVDAVLEKDTLRVKQYNPEIYLVEFNSINFNVMTSDQALDEAAAQIQELLDAAEKQIDEGEFEEALNTLSPMAEMDQFENFATNHQRSTHSFLLAKAKAQQTSQKEANEVLSNLKLEPKKCTPTPAPSQRTPHPGASQFHTAPASGGGPHVRRSVPAVATLPSGAGAAQMYRTSPNMPPCSPYGVTAGRPSPSPVASNSDPSIPTQSPNLGSIRSMAGRNPYASSPGGNRPDSQSPPVVNSAAPSPVYGSVRNFQPASAAPPAATATASPVYGSVRNFQPASAAQPPAATGNYGSYGNYSAAQSAAQPPAASATANYGSYGNYTTAQAGAPPPASYGNYPNAVPQAGANPLPASNLYGFRGNASAYSSVVPKNP